MLMTDGGQLIRTHVRDVRIARRQTQGVTLLRVEEGDRVVSVTRIGDTVAEAEAENGAASDAGNGTSNGSAGNGTSNGSAGNGTSNGSAGNGTSNGSAGNGTDNGGGEGTA
jgi:hypothetical protein